MGIVNYVTMYMDSYFCDHVWDSYFYDHIYGQLLL